MADQEILSGSDEPKAPLYEGLVSEFVLTEEMMVGLNPTERMKRTRQAAFLRALAVRGIILDGLRAAGVSRGSYSYWCNSDPWFEEMVWNAHEEARDRIEAEAIRRAVDGYDEPVIYQGVPTTVVDKETGLERMLTIRKFSDNLMQTLLKGARPEKYRDNFKVEVNGGGGQAVGVLIVPANISQDAWAEEARIQQAKFAGSGGTDQ